MKKFLHKFTVFVFLGFILLQIFASIVMSSSNYFSERQSWFDVYKRILKSKKSIASDIIYLGDSVGGQFFHNISHESHLTSNGSIFMAGHYILAYNAVSKNKHIKTIVLITTPITIGHKFENNRTYNNFIKPFFTFSNLKHFDSSIYKKMSKKPASFLDIFPGHKVLPLSDVDFTDNKKKNRKYSQNFQSCI